MANKNKKLKFLAVKLSSLESELKISKEILQSAGQEVEKMFQERYFSESRTPEHQKEIEVDEENKEIKEYSEKQKNKKDEEPKQEQKQESKQKEITIPSVEKVKDPEVKDLFKKIASKIHPDKLTNAEHYEKNKKKELFDRAMAAMEDNNLILLADIAIELELEIPDLSQKRLKQTEQKIIAIKKELNMIESTYVWKWFFTEDEKVKKNILEELFGIMYEQKYGFRP